MANHKRKRRNKDTYKLIVVAIFLVIIIIVFHKAPNYVLDLIPKQTIRLIYNTDDLTLGLVKPIIRDEKEDIYIAVEDIRKIWDENIYYDEQNEQIVTSTDKKLATMKKGEKIVTVNSSKVETYGTLLEIEGTYYLPILEFQDIYNIDVQYIEKTNTVTIDYLEERYLVARAKKNIGIKLLKDSNSRSVDKVHKGESIILDINQDLNEDWLKVRTQNGKVGYVKNKQISNISTLRDELTAEKQIAGDVYLFIDEFASPANAPDRTGEPLDQKVNAVAPTLFRIQKSNDSNLRTNIGNAGTNYISWAHNQEYRVWPMITNYQMEETTENLLNDYALREKLINDIVSAILKYDLDGITLRFESVQNSQNLIKFVSELSPRLKEIGKVFVFDKTKVGDIPMERIEKEVDYIIQDSYEESKLITLK